MIGKTGISKNEVTSIVMAALLIGSSLAVTTFAPFKQVAAEEQSAAPQNMQGADFEKSKPQFLEKKSGNHVYRVWQDMINGSPDIFFTASEDNGKTFGPIINLSSNPGNSTNPRMVVSGNQVFVVWTDDSLGVKQLFLRSSSDYGSSFNPVLSLVSAAGDLIGLIVDADKNKAITKWKDGIGKAYSNVTKVVKRGTNYTKYLIKNLGSLKPTFAVQLGLPEWTCATNGSKCVGIDVKPFGDGLRIRSGLVGGEWTGVNNPTGNPSGLVKILDPRTKLNLVNETWALRDGDNTIGLKLLNIVNSKVGNNANVTETFSTSPDVGQFVVTYMVREGLPLKHQVSLTGVSGSHSFVIGQLWSLRADTIRTADNNTRKIDDFIQAFCGSSQSQSQYSVTVNQKKCTVNKEKSPSALQTVQFVSAGKPVVTEFLNSSFGYLPSSYDKFMSLALTELSGGIVNTTFLYGAFNSSFSLDPDTCTTACTFNKGGQVAADTGSMDSGNCFMNADTGGLTQTTPAAASFGSQLRSNHVCLRAFFEWNTSAIPVGHPTTINSISITYKISASSGMTGKSCDYTQLSTQPSILNWADQTKVQTQYDDDMSAPVYVPNNAQCNAAANNSVTIPLSSSPSDQASKDLNNHLGWFAVGVIIDPWKEDGTTHGFTSYATGPSPSITVTYTYTP